MAKNEVSNWLDLLDLRDYAHDKFGKLLGGKTDYQKLFKINADKIIEMERVGKLLECGLTVEITLKWEDGKPVSKVGFKRNPRFLKLEKVYGSKPQVITEEVVDDSRSE